MRKQELMFAILKQLANVEVEIIGEGVVEVLQDGFDPPHTTIHVGTMQGGTILNIIPEHAEFIMEWRTIPGDDGLAAVERLKRYVAEMIEPAMRDVRPTAGFSFEVLTTMPGLALDADHELTAVVKQLTGSNSTGKVSYGTEGGYYQNAGIPTIICGPGHIAQAHQPVEADLARLRQAGIGMRAELGVHPVAGPCRGDIESSRHTRHLAIQQQPHRGRQGAVGRAGEPAVRARLHRRVPEYRRGLVAVPYVERLRQAAQPTAVGRL